MKVWQYDDRNPDTFMVWQSAGVSYDSWRSFVGSLVEQSYRRTDEYREYADALASIFDRIEAHDPELAGEAKRTIADAIGEAGYHHTLLAFALARTWPAGMDGFDGWLERAKKLADVE